MIRPGDVFPEDRLTVSVSLGGIGERTMAATGLEMPPLTVQQIEELHLERLRSLGWDEASQTIGRLAEHGIEHMVVPSRRGVWQGRGEVNARIIAPRDERTARWVCALLGRKGLQDAVGVFVPDPSAPRNILGVRRPGGGVWSAEELAGLEERVGIGLDQSNCGEFALFIDYTNEGDALWIKIIAALQRAGVGREHLVGLSARPSLVEAPDYGRVLRARYPTGRAGRPPVLPRARTDGDIRAALQALEERGGRAPDDFPERLDRFHDVRR